MSTSEHQHWLAPYQVRHGIRAVIKGEVQLDRDEILHHLRGYLEYRHREELYCQLRAPLRMNCLSQLDRSQTLDFRNKTVPVYLLTGEGEKTGLSGLLLMVLHNYLYRRWFRPYRSNIECGQFVAKVVLTIDQPDTKDEDSAVDLAMRMHTMINTRLDSIKAPQFYTTRPLFRAIAIVIPGQSYYTCGLVSRIATMPVLLVLTGEHEGLSAPISFDSIADRTETVTIGGKEAVRTNLETAVDFVMFLEKREESAFGPQPDPIASTDASALGDWTGEWIYENVQLMANQLGWDDEPLVGPSSQGADTDKYPDWTGQGAHTDAVVAKCLEQNGWRFHAKFCSCNDSASLVGSGRRDRGVEHEEKLPQTS